MFLHTLDNTSWSIADIIGPIGTGTHNFLINFTANETEYASIHFVGDANSGHVYYDDTLVASYPLTVWEDAAYQQIVIAGGIDATNPTLLAWFKQYAKNATPSGGDVDIIGALNDIAEAISGGGSGGGLPDTTEASAGDVLSLDEDKKPTWSTPSGGGSSSGGVLMIHCNGAATIQSGKVFIPTDCTGQDVLSCIDTVNHIFKKPIFIHLPVLENSATGEYSYSDNRSAVYLMKSFAQLIGDEAITTIGEFSYGVAAAPEAVFVAVAENIT